MFTLYQCMKCRMAAKAAAKSKDEARQKAAAVKANARNRWDEALFLVLLDITLIPAVHVVMGTVGYHIK